MWHGGAESRILRCTSSEPRNGSELVYNLRPQPDAGGHFPFGRSIESRKHGGCPGFCAESRILPILWHEVGRGLPQQYGNSSGGCVRATGEFYKFIRMHIQYKNHWRQGFQMGTKYRESNFLFLRYTSIHQNFAKSDFLFHSRIFYVWQNFVTRGGICFSKI